MIDIKIYETSEGSSPFDEWFMGLDTQAALKIRTAIARMEIGNKGDTKTVGNGVLERRINYGPGYRIYFAMDGATLIILLYGGTKKRQDKDIETAKKYWADYKIRKKQGE
jgi:putative addiction module killer protein